MRGVLGCQGRDQLLLVACSFTWAWLMILLQTLLWLGCQGQAASEGMTWPFTCQSLLGSLSKTLQPPDERWDLLVGRSPWQDSSTRYLPATLLNAVSKHYCAIHGLFFFLQQKREMNYPHLPKA